MFIQASLCFGFGFPWTIKGQTSGLFVDASLNRNQDCDEQASLPFKRTPTLIMSASTSYNWSRIKSNGNCLLLIPIFQFLFAHFVLVIDWNSIMRWRGLRRLMNSNFSTENKLFISSKLCAEFLPFPSWKILPACSAVSSSTLRQSRLWVFVSNVESNV